MSPDSRDFDRVRDPEVPHPPRSAGRAPGSPVGPAPKTTESCTRRSLAGTTRLCKGAGRGRSRLGHCLAGRSAGTWRPRGTPGIVPSTRWSSRAPSLCSLIRRACSRPRAVPARATYPAGPGCTSELARDAGRRAGLRPPGRAG